MTVKDKGHISKDNNGGPLKYLEFIFEYGIDIGNRIIYFNDDVEQDSVDRVIKAVNFFEKEKDPIQIKICSYGGSVDQMFALYDKIVSSENKIITVGTGCICSAAVLLLACGNERFVTENAWLMSHNAETVGIGSPATLMSQAKAFQAMEDTTWALLEKHSRWTAKKWKESAEKKGEVWLTPKQMLTCGIIDGILPNPPVEKDIPKKAPVRKKTTRKR